jgi:hypothetical protein
MHPALSGQYNCQPVAAPISVAIIRSRAATQVASGSGCATKDEDSGDRRSAGFSNPITLATAWKIEQAAKTPTPDLQSFSSTRT